MRTILRKALRLSPVVISFIAAGQACAADDACAAVRDAIAATLKVPSVRQYMALRDGAPERLASVITRDTVYISMDGRWDKTPRSEYQENAGFAERAKKVTDCKRAGSGTVNGESVSIVEYTVQVMQLPALRSKAWIGSDGLLRKHSSAGHGYVRYEYKDVHAPT
jgi:hypothetical protein